MSNTTLPSDTDSASATPGLYSRWLDVTISHIVDSDPVRITFYFEMILNNGARKQVSKSAAVTGVALQERLRRDAKLHDPVRVCLETDWDADNIPTVLKDFCLR